jgi:hypothetical protein
MTLNHYGIVCSLVSLSRIKVFSFSCARVAVSGVQDGTSPALVTVTRNRNISLRIPPSPSTRGRPRTPPPFPRVCSPRLGPLRIWSRAEQRTRGLECCGLCTGSMNCAGAVALINQVLPIRQWNPCKDERSMISCFLIHWLIADLQNKLVA